MGKLFFSSLVFRLVIVFAFSKVGHHYANAAHRTLSRTKHILTAFPATDLGTCLTVSHQLAKNCSRYTEEMFRMQVVDQMKILVESLQMLNSSLCPKHDKAGSLSCSKLNSATNSSVVWQSSYQTQLIQDMKQAVCMADFQSAATAESVGLRRLDELLAEADISAFANNATAFDNVLMDESASNESASLTEARMALNATVTNFRTLLSYPAELGFLFTTAPSSLEGDSAISGVSLADVALALSAQRFVVCSGTFPTPSLKACAGNCLNMSLLAQAAETGSAFSGQPQAKTTYRQIIEWLNATCDSAVASNGRHQCLDRSCGSNFVCGPIDRVSASIALTEVKAIIRLLDGIDFKTCLVLVVDGFNLNCEGFFARKLKSDLLLPLEQLFRAIGGLTQLACPDLGKPGVLNCAVLFAEASKIIRIDQEAAAANITTNATAVQLGKSLCVSSAKATAADKLAEQQFLASLSESSNILLRVFTQGINLELFLQDTDIIGKLLSKPLDIQLGIQMAMKSIEKNLPTYERKAMDYLALFAHYLVPFGLYFDALPARLDRVEDSGRDIGFPKGDAVYVDTVDGYLTCAAIYPHKNLRNCPWLCRNLTSLLEMTDFFSPGVEFNRKNSRSYQILHEMTLTCESPSSTTWKHCIDPSCDNTNKVCENNEKSPEMVKARHLANGLCFRAICPFPLRETPVREHWIKEVQEVLTDALNTSQIVFPDLNFTFNGSVLACGRDCVSVGFSKDDNDTAKIVLGVFGWILFIMTFLALISFYLNRERLNRFPTQILLYMNLTAGIGNFGFLMRFFVDVESFTCHDDGTLREKEPDDSAACTLSFVFTSYNLLASLFWWLCLTHAWYITFRTMRTRGARPEENKHYMIIYHCIAWGFPWLFVSIMLGLKKVDGFPLYGICFTQDGDAWFWYASLPIGIVNTIGLPFLVLAVRITRKHQKSELYRSGTVSSSPPDALRRSVSTEGLEHLRGFMTQMLFILIFTYCNLEFQFFSGLSTKISWKDWEKDTEDSVICRMTNCQPELCGKIPTLSLTLFILMPVSIIIQGIALCSWIFSGEVWKTWKSASRHGGQMIRAASQVLLVQRSWSRRSSTSNPYTSSQASMTTEQGKTAGGKQKQYVEPADLVLAYTEQIEADDKSHAASSATPMKTANQADSETKM